MITVASSCKLWWYYHFHHVLWFHASVEHSISLAMTASSTTTWFSHLSWFRWRFRNSLHSELRARNFTFPHFLCSCECCSRAIWGQHRTWAHHLKLRKCLLRKLGLLTVRVLALLVIGAGPRIWSSVQRLFSGLDCLFDFLIGLLSSGISRGRSNSRSRGLTFENTYRRWRLKLSRFVAIIVELFRWASIATEWPGNPWYLISRWSWCIVQCCRLSYLLQDRRYFQPSSSSVSRVIPWMSIGNHHEIILFSPIIV